MANVFEIITVAVSAEHLALEVYPREVRPHERLICHTRISKKGNYLYKAYLSKRAKWKDNVSPVPLGSRTN